MLEQIKRLLGPATAGGPADDDRRLHVATCVLLLEVAHADSRYQQEEDDLVRELLVKKFGLPSGAADAVMAQAQRTRESTVDLYQFTKQINENFSIDEKLDLMEELWRLVYADGILDKFEDALMHRLATLLRLSHRQMIAVKVKVLDEIRPDR